MESSNKHDGGRIEQIDLFRAYALLGLFLVHCVELFELHWADPQSSPIFELIFSLFAGKAFAMFALSFGLSYTIILKGAEARGENYSGTFLWRLFLLFLFGVAHTAIYRGDILMLLGLVGMLLVPFNRLQSNLLLFASAFVFIFNVPLILRLAMVYQGWPSSLPALVQANDMSMAAYMQGGVATMLWANLTSGNLVKWLYMLEAGRVSQLLGMMLLGLILGRIGFFSDLAKFQKARWLIIVTTALIAFSLTAKSEAIAALFPESAHSDAGFYIGNLVNGWANMLFAIMQTMLVFELWYLLKGRFVRVFAPVGQMSLTFYILQSLVFVPLLYNAGLGLYDDAPAITWFWVGVITFVLQAVLAVYWMKAFRQGPLEWGWRAMTKRSVDVPFKRV